MNQETNDYCADMMRLYRDCVDACTNDDERANIANIHECLLRFLALMADDTQKPQ